MRLQLFFLLFPFLSYSQLSLDDLLTLFEKNEKQQSTLLDHCELNYTIDEKVKLKHFIDHYHHKSEWRYYSRTFECDKAIYQIELQDALIMDENWYQTIIIQTPKNGAYYQHLLTSIKSSSAFQGLVTWETASRQEEPGMRYFLANTKRSKVYQGFFISILPYSNIECLGQDCIEIRISAKGWEHSYDMSKKLLDKIK